MAVKNNSSNTVYIKPENDDVPVAVEKGTAYIGKQDGIAVPIKHPGKVYKTVNDVDAVVDKNGDIDYSSNDLLGMAGQPVKGGWLDSAPDSSWNKIFEKSKP